MLGPVNSASGWQWAAYGKHPVAKDYISWCEHFPLVKTFSNWIDKGYQLLRPDGGPAPHPHSWRFWAGGARGDTLACGLLRDSRDGVGRTYPFLILGSGLLNQWNEHWDLLPLACEQTWGQMEKASVRAYEGVKGLEDELRRIPPPYPQWSELVKEKEGLWGGQDVATKPGLPDMVATIGEQVRAAQGASELYVPLRQWPGLDPFALVSCWHSLLKSHQQVTPNVVFMGGRPDATCLAVFRRPLVPADFVRLWSCD